MRAVVATPELIDAEVAEPTPGPHDLVLQVEAVAAQGRALLADGHTIGKIALEGWPQR